MKIKNRFQVINNPIDIDRVETLSSYNSDISIKPFNDTFTFINVARFKEQKNHALLIQAFSYLSKYADVYLVLIGEGELMENSKKQCIELKISEKVQFLGFDNNPYKYLIKADCFVLTSDYEGFPNVIVEALACGLPVISTDCSSGPREILAPNSDVSNKLTDKIELQEFGILTPVGNEDLLLEAMKVIINNPDIKRSYMIKSKKRALDFESGVIIKQFNKLFQE